MCAFNSAECDHIRQIAGQNGIAGHEVTGDRRDNQTNVSVASLHIAGFLGDSHDDWQRDGKPAHSRWEQKAQRAGTRENSKYGTWVGGQQMLHEPPGDITSEPRAHRRRADHEAADDETRRIRPEARQQSQWWRNLCRESQGKEKQPGSKRRQRIGRPYRN